jgi:hypothetical protein
VNAAVDIALIGTLAVVMLAAGLLADGLPTARTAAEMRRRARLLSTLVGVGAVIYLSLPVVTTLMPGASNSPAAALLMGVPMVVVLTTTRRRLAQVRGGAGAFATAPRAPVPPGLIAAAAHPLIAAPLQVAGLAAIIGVPIAAGLVDRTSVEVSGAAVVGIALTATGLAVLATGIRHGLRHSRLSVRAIAPLQRWGPIRPVTRVRGEAQLDRQDGRTVR